MPASLCGVIGLKPTFARIPHDGWGFIFFLSCLISGKVCNDLGE